MKKIVVTIMIFISAVLLSGVSISAEEVSGGLIIDPDAIIQQNNSGGLTTYGLHVKLFTSDSNDNAIAITQTKQASLDKTVDGLFISNDGDPTGGAKQAQQLVFSEAPNHYGDSADAQSSSLQSVIVTALAFVLIMVASYAVTKIIKKRKKG